MQVKFFNEEYPVGIEFDIGGILLINGESIDVSDEQAEQFENRNGKTLVEALESNPNAVDFYKPEVTYVPTPQLEVVETDQTGDDYKEGDN